MKEIFEKLVVRFHLTRRRLATVGVLAIAAAIAFHVVFGANGALVYQKKKDEYRRLQTEIQDLDHENQAMADQVKALKSDPKAIEREARETLHYVRPGEVIYTTPAPAQPAKPEKPETMSAEKK